MKIVLFTLTMLCSFELTAIAQSGNVGIGTTAPAEKLHVNGKIRVDTTNTSTANPVSITLSNVRASAGTIWQMPMGWKADNTLAILPGQLQTTLNLNQSSTGTLLSLPSVLWGTGASDNDFYAVKVEGFYNEGCAATDPYMLMTIYVRATGINATINGAAAGTVSSPSAGVYAWTGPSNNCGFFRTFTYNASTRTLSYGGTGGTTTLTGTATLYGNTFP